MIVCSSSQILAQTANDTSRSVPIEILPGKGTLLEFIATDSGGINKLIGNVALKQGDTRMFCDSAYILREHNTMQAWGNVHIIQDDGATEVKSDYLRYTGNIRKAYLRGNVHLKDGNNHLRCPELEYNLASKIGIYIQGGTLQNDTTSVSSDKGVYYGKLKEARFTDNVMVTDPSYEIISDDLGYHTESKIVSFYGPSVVTSDSSQLRTSLGTWDAIREHAVFYSRSSVWTNEQYVEADTIDFHKKTGFGEAWGNVILLDTIQQITLYSGYAQYNQRTKQMLATLKPVLKKLTDNDSLFIRADTFYAAPVTQVATSVLEHADTTTLYDSEESSIQRYFIGYHHVIVFSDSLQAVCDSISYSQADSIMRMMGDPIAWSRKSQITGDTILIYMDSSNHVERLYIPNNAFVVSMSGPEQAQLFDQVQGKTLTAYFDSNVIRKMVVRPNVTCIYYALNDQEEYIGVHQASCEQLSLFFEGEELDRIILEPDVDHKMIPMLKADLPSMRLSRFRWHPEKRPRSRDELFQ